MKKVLFLLVAILTALSVFGKDVLIARSGDNSLTLHDTPCGKEVSALLKPEYVTRFRAATDKANGVVFKACWTLHDQENVYVLYEDGDRAMVPLTEFSRPGKAAPAKPLKGSV